jgi:hypothetical protein
MRACWDWSLHQVHMQMYVWFLNIKLQSVLVVLQVHGGYRADAGFW